MTADDIDSDPLRARLRAADPAATLPPADADTVARLVEQTTTAPRDRRRGPLTWVVAAAAAAVIVVAATTLIAVRGGQPEPVATPQGEETTEPGAPAAAVTTLTAGTPAAGRCLPPSAQALADQDIAFAGTVEQVADGRVTLRTDEVYAGDVFDRVEIEAPDVSLEMLIGAVGFEEGGRYLVAASEGSISYCGLTGPATPALQRLYDQAFGQ